MNYLIDKTGKEIVCEHGQTHEQICKSVLHTTLSNFLGRMQQGIRIKIYRDGVIIEGYDYPNEKQVREINAILRTNPVFHLITSFRGEYDVQDSFTRPIRRLK